MFTRIMVPLDGSALAEQALPVAGHLAEVEGATLHLVRVVEPPAAVTIQRLGAPVNVYEEVIAAAWQEATAYLEEMRARLERQGYPVQIQRLDGYAAATLLDYAREAGIDLLVMTTHGRTGLTRWALGSVVDRVVQGNVATVLLVPAGG